MFWKVKVQEWSELLQISATSWVKSLSTKLMNAYKRRNFYE